MYIFKLPAISVAAHPQRIPGISDRSHRKEIIQRLIFNSQILIVKPAFESLKMAVSFITRLLMLALGYAYPAYDCYKTLELKNLQIEQLRFWCQYWVLLAFLTVFERFADCTISWLPMYGEAKLAFVVYLWYPMTRGAEHVYGSYLQPLLARHEAGIDRSLLELRARAMDMTASHLKAAVTVGQAWLVEAARHVSSQLQAARSARAAAQVQ